MARLVLVLLAALTASIGLVIEQPWLHAGAALLVLVAIGLWVRRRRAERRREERSAARAETAEEEDDLRALGITDIRPRDEEAKTQETETQEAETQDADRDASNGEPPVAEPPAGAESPEPAPDQASASPADAPAPASSEQEHSTPAEAAEEQPPAEEQSSASDGKAPEKTAPPPPETTDAETTDALTALVRAARLATGARVACLLAQEELALEYRLEAADADAEAPSLHAPGTTFSTEAALLSAHAADQPVTRRSVGSSDDGDELAPGLLGYYRQPPAGAAAPEAVLLAPVPRPDDPTSYFLLLDGARETLAGPDILLERFARLFAQLLAAPSGAWDPSPSPEEATAPSATSASSPPSALNGSAPSPNDRSTPSTPSQPPSRQDFSGTDSSEEDGPRPRREIVAEEMERAHAAGREMTLALIYLNRAETITDRDDEEVRAAERALKARLRQSAPDDGGRVERFGELTYGVFLPHGSRDAEDWAVALQEELAAASDPLAGGVSVGLALMRSPDQDPEALREHATQALREAYTTGTCTILE
jgi:GGDEF domain-containing protein/outer membrane biosynthesis protein TonB